MEPSVPASVVEQVVMQTGAIVVALISLAGAVWAGMKRAERKFSSQQQQASDTAGIHAHLSEAVRSIFDEYRKLHASDQARIEHMNAEVSSLGDQVATLEKTVTSLAHQVTLLTSHITSLEGIIARLGAEVPPRPQIERPVVPFSRQDAED